MRLWPALSVQSLQSRILTRAEPACSELVVLADARNNPADWFVSAEWLNENRQKPHVKIIDGTWSIPGSSTTLENAVIPGSQFVDLGKWKAATKLGAPYHPPNIVVRTLSDAGIISDDHIIIYDKQGYFSGPRIAWSFRAIGHEKVSVLRDGLPRWIDKNLPIDPEHQTSTISTAYQIKEPLVGAVKLSELVELIETDTQIVDARSAERFSGHTAEPRPGLRSGHIPGSINLPLGKVKDADGKLLEGPELIAAIESAGVDLAKPIITTCGSGVTASALAWLFYDIGKHDVSVYSGSWAEYGASDKPIETS